MVRWINEMVDRKNKNRGYQQLRFWQDAITFYQKADTSLKSPEEFHVIPSLHYSIAPSLHHSITPSLHHSSTPCPKTIRESR